MFKKSEYFKHDNKVNIEAGSILEDIKIDIRIAYFIIFYNFIERYSINKAFINCKEFTNQLNINTISRKAISKLYNIVRMKIMKSTYEN